MEIVLFTCKLVYIIILYMTDNREMCKVINIQWKNKELNDSNRFLYNLKYLVDPCHIYLDFSTIIVVKFYTGTSTLGNE